MYCNRYELRARGLDLLLIFIDVMHTAHAFYGCPSPATRVSVSSVLSIGQNRQGRTADWWIACGLV